MLSLLTKSSCYVTRFYLQQITCARVQLACASNAVTPLPWQCAIAAPEQSIALFTGNAAEGRVGSNVLRSLDDEASPSANVLAVLPPSEQTTLRAIKRGFAFTLRENRLRIVGLKIYILGDKLIDGRSKLKIVASIQVVGVHRAVVEWRNRLNVQRFFGSKNVATGGDLEACRGGSHKKINRRQNHTRPQPVADDVW